MPRATSAAADPSDAADAPLKRLGGGRWQTRDERFTIEPQSGTWVVVDAEQTDDLGMPLVRGPFRSLTEAKDAIGTARTTEPAESPLVERIERRRQTPAGEARSAAKASSRSEPGTRAGRGRSAVAPKPASRKPAAGGPARKDAPAAAEAAEPHWLAALDPDERGRARRLIEHLGAAGIDDAESVVRRDLVGDVPAIATIAVGRALAGLGPSADPATVAALLAEGRDDELGVRWRLVDGGGRPIGIEPSRVERARGR